MCAECVLSFVCGAEVEPIKTSAARWIAADAVAWLEVPCPELVIDRLTDPRIESYLKVLPQYQKYVKSKDFREYTTSVESVATQLDTTWEQGLRDLTKGGVLLGLEVDAGSPSPPRVYLIVSPANTGLLDRLSGVVLKLARQDAKNKGKPDPVKTSQYRGMTVHTGSGEKDPAFAIVSGRLAVSNSVKFMAVNGPLIWSTMRCAPCASITTPAQFPASWAQLITGENSARAQRVSFTG